MRSGRSSTSSVVRPFVVDRAETLPSYHRPPERDPSQLALLAHANDARVTMKSGIVEGSDGVQRERLQWSLDTGARSYALDLFPAAFGGSVSLQIDGRVVRRMPKPKPQRPWQETALEIDGQPVVVALIWHHPVMRTDVFLGARSLLDGRTIDDVRKAAPSPMSNYATWVGGLFWNKVAPRRPFLPRMLGLVALAAIVVPVALFALLPRPIGLAVGLAWAVVAFVAYLIVLLIWVRSWGVVAERAHLHLLTRPELGDAGRLVRFFAAFVGYGLAALAALGVVVAILAFVGG